MDGKEGAKVENERLFLYSQLAFIPIQLYFCSE
jgi:hypothetical protein